MYVIRSAWALGMLLCSLLTSVGVAVSLSHKTTWGVAVFALEWLACTLWLFYLRRQERQEKDTH